MEIQKIIFLSIVLIWAWLLWEATGIMDEVRKELKELANDVMRLTKRAADASPESPLKNKRQLAKRR